MGEAVPGARGTDGRKEGPEFRIMQVTGKMVGEQPLQKQVEIGPVVRVAEVGQFMEEDIVAERNRKPNQVPRRRCK